MGQYYKPVNIDTMECLESWDYGNGSKLMEHSYIGNNFVEAVEMLLLPGARWDMARLVWAGDYADNEKGTDHNLYSMANDTLKMLIEACPPDHHYLVNFDKKEYVDKRKCPSIIEEHKSFGDDYQVHPLPILLSEGCGRGGGDYTTNDYTYVGSWARDRIGLRIEAPEGFTEIRPDFVEEPIPVNSIIRHL